METDIRQRAVWLLEILGGSDKACGSQLLAWSEGQRDGLITDVIVGGPTRKAGVSPSVKLIAVNNRRVHPDVLREAVAKTASDAKPLELLIKTGEYYEVHRVDYRGGERYPHLERDAAVPDPYSRRSSLRGRNKQM